MSDARALVAKLWTYCNVLRDDELSYGDYLVQLSYLLVHEDGRRAAPARVASCPRISTYPISS